MSVALSREEEKNKRIAAGISVAVHAILLLLLIYILAWRAPDPPAAEMGIELNFGMDNVGSGDVQTQATPNESKNVEDSKPAPTQPDVQPEPAVQPTPPRPVEAPKVQTTTADAPVAVKEVEKPQPKPQPKEEPVKEPEKPKALYPGKTSTTTGTGKTGTSSEATGNNNGDDADKVGDKGNPDGKLDAKALYGKQGGGAGGDLDMAGWGWGTRPKPNDSSLESGKIVIKVVVNADGVVESATVVESTVSPSVSKLYRDEVFRRATFVRTAGGSGGATGYITYRLKVN